MNPKCPHCESDQSSYQFKMRKREFFQCPYCELVYCDGDKEEISYGSGRYDLKRNEREMFLEQIQKVLQSNFKGKGKILVIGSNAGEIVEDGISAGLDIKGIVPNFDCLKDYPHLKDKGLLSVNKVEEFAGNEGDVFEVCLILRFHKQLSNLSQFMAQIRRFLQPKGILLLHSSLFDGYRTGKSSTLRPLKLAGDQKYFFNTQNLETFLIKNGFTNILTNCFKEEQKSSSYFSFFSKRKAFIQATKTQTSVTQKLSIILPVYNEKSTFQELMEKVVQRKLDGLEKEIIVVESNSTDGSHEEVKKYEKRPGIKVVYEDRPRGKGHAVRTGLKHATGDLILIQDADLEYDINDYDDLLRPLIKCQKMFVLGSRHTGTWKMRSFEDRKFLSALFNFGQILFTGMINLACGSRLKDPFTMYKVFRKECLYGLVLESNRFDLDWELVIKFLRKKYFPLELPVNYQSRSFKEGKKVRLIHDPLLWMKALFKFRFCKLYPASKF